MSLLRGLVPCLGVVLLACASGDGNPGDDDPGDGDSKSPPKDDDSGTPQPKPEPEPDPAPHGIASLTVEGRQWQMDLSNPVGFATNSLDVRARHRFGAGGLDIFLSDVIGLGEGKEYSLGVWGSPTNERTDVTVWVVDGEQFGYGTAKTGKSPGTLTIDKLDVVNQVISLSWSGTFDKVNQSTDTELGTATVSGSVVDVPYELP